MKTDLFRFSSVAMLMKRMDGQHKSTEKKRMIRKLVVF